MKTDLHGAQSMPDAVDTPAAVDTKTEDKPDVEVAPSAPTPTSTDTPAESDAMEMPSPDEVAAIIAEKDSALAEVARLSDELAALREMEKEVPGLREALDAAQKRAADMMAERDAMAAEKEGMSRSHAMEKAGLLDPYGDYMCGKYDEMKGEDKLDFAAFLDSMKASHPAMFKAADAFDGGPDAGSEAVDAPAEPKAPSAVGNPANTVPKPPTATPSGPISKADLPAMSFGDYERLRSEGKLAHLGIHPL